MKQLLAAIALLYLHTTAMAQEKGTARLYGYYQPVSAGKAPEANPGTGLQTSAGQGKNYILYAVSSSRIYPAEIWVEGTRMGVTLRVVTRTPIMHGDDGNMGSPKQELVPQTTQKVIKLVLAPPIEGKDFGSRAGSLAKENELVLVYKEQGKFRYSVLPRLRALNGVAAQ